MTQQVDAALALLHATLGDQKAIYLSSPITTGRYYFEKLPDYIEANKRKAIMVANEIRRNGSFCGLRTIEPAYFGLIHGWTHENYMQLWRKVIVDYVDTVVFVSGWEFSDGCLDEYVCAVLHGKTVLDEELRSIPFAKALVMVEFASTIIKARGFEPSVMRNSNINQLRRLVAN